MQIEIKETDIVEGLQTFVRLSTGQTFAVTAPGVIDTGEATAEIVHVAEEGPGPTQDFLRKVSIRAALGSTLPEQVNPAVGLAHDHSMSRVLEDLMGVLVAKGVIALTDLPQASQDKIAARAALRAQLSA
jgi:hypothetical protein